MNSASEKMKVSSTGQIKVERKIFSIYFRQKQTKHEKITDRASKETERKQNVITLFNLKCDERNWDKS